MTAKPNLFIVGAMKAGTTSLAGYLDQHPDITFCVPKELNFFGAKAEGRSPEPPSPEEYRRLFDAHRTRYSGEATVQYLYSRAAPEEIRAHNPNARILAILRNPIDRAYSHFNHNAKSIEKRTFERAVEDERNGVGTNRFLYDWGYLELGSYATQVERYLRTFGDAGLRVLVTEQLDADADGVCKGVLRFLDVDTTVPLDTRERLNPSGKLRFGTARTRVLSNPLVRAIGRAFVSPRMRSRIILKIDSLLVDKRATPSLSPALRARLAEHFSKDVARLRELTGLRFTEWRDF
jgi:hypothetical protein